MRQSGGVFYRAPARVWGLTELEEMRVGFVEAIGEDLTHVADDRA